MATNIILNHGRYKKLLSYQKSRVVYEITIIFCNRFLDYRDRTVDQMVQAARSGKQNIVEGSMAAGTSKEMEIKLTNVARASLGELLEDYRDYLRTHGHRAWNKSSPEAVHMRRAARNLKDTEKSILDLVRTRKAAEVCNIAICLINQANYLLDQQLRHLERSFLPEGGFREHMYHARRRTR